ncbi:trimeric intracellular cation channel family protein [Carnobacterium jeotgali]|uniref:trimeric intracellular cation channel family protein n=1 Tax=Carnobacterium jeotgali TaxID=545534 RepID=UPI003890DD97
MTDLTWEILNIIGTIAFAISGAFIAIDAKYDLLGVYILGFTTAFGGGLIRNLIIGLPVQNIWMQNTLFKFAFLAITLVLLLPNIWNDRWKVNSIEFFDAIGLAAFAIQGANYAVSTEVPIVAVIFAAIITGAGGGLLRDLFAGRKPMIFHSEIYALWAAIAGLIIGIDWVSGSYVTIVLFISIVGLRVLSLHYNWSLPRSFYVVKNDKEN